MKVKTRVVETRTKVKIRVSEVGNSRYNTITVDWNPCFAGEAMHAHAARELGRRSWGFVRAVRDPEGDHDSGYVFDVDRPTALNGGGVGRVGA